MRPFWRRAFPLDLAEESHYSRREFARFLALVSSGFTAGIGYLWARKRPLDGAPVESEGHTGEALSLGSATALEVGQSKLFTYRDAQDSCVLIRTAEGHRAYRQTCTHLGCAVRWNGQRLECPCHQDSSRWKRASRSRARPPGPSPASPWKSVRTAPSGPWATCPSPTTST